MQFEEVPPSGLLPFGTTDGHSEEALFDPSGLIGYFSPSSGGIKLMPQMTFWPVCSGPCDDDGEVIGIDKNWLESSEGPRMTEKS